jgi:hypothetical protein
MEASRKFAPSREGFGGPAVTPVATRGPTGCLAGTLLLGGQVPASREARTAADQNPPWLPTVQTWACGGANVRRVAG